MGKVAKTVVLSIDLNKVDETKVFKGKNGARYLDVVLMNTPDNQYGSTYMAVQGVSKEEREAGERGAILGNGKVFGAGQGEENSQSSMGGNSTAKGGESNGGDNLPF